MRTIIILSGGMDSTTLLYAAPRYSDREFVTALSFDYGQKHSKELHYAKWHCDFLGLKHGIINLESITPFLQSTLLKGGDPIPDGHYEDKIMRKTVVPFRNGIMLSIAVGVAESMKADVVMFGAHAGDHAVYPDCREAFYKAFNEAAIKGTYKNVTIEAPFGKMSKRDIALFGRGLDINYARTWSCYKTTEKHCGTCGTCIERKEALKGFDPTEYQQEN